MAIISTTQTPASVQASGEHRGSATYFFDDGRQVVRHIKAATAEEYNALPAVLADAVLAAEVTADAQEAARIGVLIAYKQAPQTDVYYAWMQSAYNEIDPLTAYKTMLPVAPTLVAMGYTAAQYAAIFNAEEAQVQRLLDRWAYLSANSAALLAYETTVAGDV